MQPFIQPALIFETILFISTFLFKLSHWDEHVDAVRQYAPSEISILVVVGATITSAMDCIVVISCTLIPSTLFTGCFILGVLLMYSAFLLAKILREGSTGSHTKCACGGLAGDHEIGPSLLVRNSVYIIPAVILLSARTNTDLIRAASNMPLYTFIIGVLEAGSAILSVYLLMLIASQRKAFMGRIKAGISEVK